MYFAKYCQNCKKSTHCCVFEDKKGFTFLTPSDAKAISDFTGLAPRDFVQYTPLSKDVILDLETCDEVKEGSLRATQLDSKGRILRLKTRENGRCIFLQDDGKCGIYGVRPNICRIYPFWAMRLLDDKIKVIRHDVIPTCPIIRSLEKKTDDVELVLTPKRIEIVTELYVRILKEQAEYKRDIKGFIKEHKLD
jgi:Fe-S-cluster containining protein